MIQIADGTIFTTYVSKIVISGNVGAGTLVVFNIQGMTGGFVNLDMESLQHIPAVFNFVSATSLSISGVAVRGMIVAPFATINGGPGVVWGNVYAYSMAGPLQVNVVPDFPLCQNPNSLLQLYVTLNSTAATDGASSDAVAVTGAYAMVAMVALLSVMFYMTG